MKVVWLADNFLAETDWKGGAEHSSDAVMQEAPCEVVKIRVDSLTPDHIRQYASNLWILDNIISAYFGNDIFKTVFLSLQNLRFVKIDYDYGWCTKRSPVAHKILMKEDCNCLQRNDYPFRPLYSTIHRHAQHMFYMSMNQLCVHKDFIGPEFNYRTSILSSCFSYSTYTKIASLRDVKQDDTWLIMDGKNDWHKFCKGVDCAIEFAKQNKLNSKLVGGVTHEELLNEMSRCRGAIFLPQNLDTCPRIVIEARLMDRNVYCNEMVQHKDESWFKDKKGSEIEKYLRGRPAHFWDIVKDLI